MAHFNVASNGATGVVIAAASTGNRARFLRFGFTCSTTARLITLYDGTAAAGTARCSFIIPANESRFFSVDQPGGSVFPKSWFTSGSAIEFALGAGTTEVQVWGEVVREP